MEFEEEEIKDLEFNVDGIKRLIIEYLCGEKHYGELLVKDTKLLKDLLKNAEKRGLNYEQFNELLLLLNQNRVSKGFFKFFFRENREEDKISLDDLKGGVVRFRGFAMLCFGNFRFAYKQLIAKNGRELEKRLEPYWEKSDEKLKELRGRPQRMLETESITRDETWYLGNISKQKLDKEYLIVEDLISSMQRDQKRPLEVSKVELLRVSAKYIDMQDAMINAQEKGLKNTDVYLTWDYMDVYIATSMRHKWEFQETFDFMKGVFHRDDIKGLNVRYFDPTQSKCKNRIDKGLVEGLMLKRVLCSIYMAQETDTMGKDSELAATLAQGKPVIAYIPIINIKEYPEKIKEYPLDYFEKRLLVLQAEEIFNDEACINELEGYEHDFLRTVEDFQEKLEKYRTCQHLSLWDEKEREFKEGCDSFSNICKILSVAEHYSSERRAAILKEYHPLAIQVDLQSGVANGVLVVRTLKECAELLRQILTNNMKFTIKHIGDENEGVTVLQEKTSKCPFRVVTDYEKLTRTYPKTSIFELM